MWQCWEGGKGEMGWGCFFLGGRGAWLDIKGSYFQMVGPVGVASAKEPLPKIGGWSSRDH